MSDDKGSALRVILVSLRQLEKIASEAQLPLLVYLIASAAFEAENQQKATGRTVKN